MLDEGIAAFLRQEARQRFWRYVQIETRSDPDSGRHPSSEGQWALAKVLSDELEQIGLADICLDPFCYVYATLPATEGVDAPALTFCAHMDTSPAVSGSGVKPVLHENYDGGIIRFADDPHLTLSPDDSPELTQYIGQSILTASGATLLGADDKAGLAEIMAALAAFKEFDSLAHPELRIVFTPDEEIGEGVDHIDLSRLGQFAYTMDGGHMGELENECFDAFEIKVTFKGHNIHPGYAKGRMVNAAAIAARFVAALPESQTPEHTEKREGFFHITGISGNESQAGTSMIIRDFEPNANQNRIELIQQLKRLFELRYSGLEITIDLKDQYNNMREVLSKHPEVTAKAAQAIQMAGIEPITKGIRGGTDGSRLSFMGLPTPNIFAGGLLFHSTKEWIAESALQKAAEVIVNLCGLWAGRLT